jgi:hypothetical protein
MKFRIFEAHSKKNMSNSIFELESMKSNYKEILGFDDKWLGIIGAPVIAFLLAAMMFADILVDDWFLFCRGCLIVSFIYVVIYWVVFRQVFIFFRKKYPKTGQTIKRITLQSIVLIALYFIGQRLLDPIMHDLFTPYIIQDARHDIGMAIASMLVTFLVVGIYETIGFYTRLQKSSVEKQKLKRMNMQSQLEGLKNQVNPHFLFNSLNTLTYLIPENSEKSVHFVQQLSKVYRYILEIRDKKLILLEEELNFLNAYTFLLKERFGKNLHIKIDIPEVHLNDKIIPLSLQILFENAIKHNIISSEKPLFMEVFIENGNKLIVKNNLQKKNQVMNSTKLGLQNIKNRYRFFSEKEVEVIVTQESFIVILPMIDVPVFAGND